MDITFPSPIEVTRTVKDTYTHGEIVRVAVARTPVDLNQPAQEQTFVASIAPFKIVGDQRVYEGGTIQVAIKNLDAAEADPTREQARTMIASAMTAVQKGVEILTGTQQPTTPPANLARAVVARDVRMAPPR